MYHVESRYLELVYQKLVNTRIFIPELLREVISLIWWQKDKLGLAEN